MTVVAALAQRVGPQGMRAIRGGDLLLQRYA